MKPLATILAAFGLFAVVTKAAAHSLETVESTMREEGTKVEFVNVPAPNMRLHNPDGRPVSLADFRGKVVVLNVLNSPGSQTSNVQMASIANLQAMIKVARMSNRVFFVTVVPHQKEVGPEHVDPSAFARSHGLHLSNWQLLYWTHSGSLYRTGAPASVYGLDGSTEKQAVTHVIDQTRRLRARFYGLEFGLVNLVVYVGALVNDDHSRHE